jgi:HD-like signal output (HDOD) protein
MNNPAESSLWSRLRGLFGDRPANDVPDVEELEDETLEEPDSGESVGHGLPPLLAGPGDAPILATLAKSDDPMVLSPPGVAVEVLGMVKSDNMDLSRLEQLVASDAALTASILRLANSASKAGAAGASDLTGAITRLGSEEVATVSLAHAVLSGFGKADPLAVVLGRRSMEVAFCARHLAYEKRGVDPSMVFTAGALHKVGQLMLLRSASKGYRGALEKRGLSSISTVRAERKRFGLDHASVGAHVLQGWDMPVEVVRAVAFRYRFAALVEQCPSREKLLAAVASIDLADRYVRLLSKNFDAPGPALDRMADCPAARWMGYDRDGLEQRWEEMQRVLIETGKVFEFGE